MAVDPLFAQWLQSDADNVVRSDAAAAARWGATAQTTEKVTAIAAKVDAEIEGDRQLAFFARGPFAIDVHELVGVDWLDELGKVVTFISDQLGYESGIDVFVLGAEVDRASGISAVTVIRSLKWVA